MGNSYTLPSLRSHRNAILGIKATAQGLVIARLVFAGFFFGSRTLSASFKISRICVLDAHLLLSSCSKVY